MAQIIDRLQNVLEQIAEENDSFKVHSYSGRGMYGESCLAVTTNEGLGFLFAAVLLYTTEENRDDLAESFENFRTDNMGRGTVVYFPGTEYVDPASEEEEDEFDMEPNSGDIEGEEV